MEDKYTQKATNDNLNKQTQNYIEASIEVFILLQRIGTKWVEQIEIET